MLPDTEERTQLDFSNWKVTEEENCNPNLSIEQLKRMYSASNSLIHERMSALIGSSDSFKEFIEGSWLDIELDTPVKLQKNVYVHTIRGRYPDMHNRYYEVSTCTPSRHSTLTGG